MAFADPAALEAAVLNVALNARDAMPDGGSLAIRTSTVKITDAARRPRTTWSRASTCASRSRTAARGMPPDVVARVFEPFFTTKAGGRGTGLGLSMVYGFAKQSGGDGEDRLGGRAGARRSACSCRWPAASCRRRRRTRRR